MLIDTHCHLHDLEWFTPEQQAQFLTEAHQKGVEKIICIGTNPEDSFVARDFAAQHQNVFWTYGIHPEFANQTSSKEKWWKPELYSQVNKSASTRAAQSDSPVRTGAGAVDLESKAQASSSLPCAIGVIPRGTDPEPIALCAIGEVGLDYHYAGYDRTAQIKLFEQMLQLAQDFKLPVSLHIREAFDDAFAVLANFPHLTGVVHSFTGSKRQLKTALERGFSIGVNGLATYTTLPLPPLDRIVLETDAPFLTPVPFRGKINAPGYIREIAAYLAEKLGVAESEIAEQTTQNARQIFQI